MAYSRAHSNFRQWFSFRANQTNPLPQHNSSAMRAIATAGAVLLVGASASLGAYYGYIVGSHQHVLVGVVFAGAALGGELLKPFAVEGAIDAVSRLKIVRAIACAALALVCVAYSLAAELSLAAGSRGDMAAERSEAASKSKTVAAERIRAEAELATLPPARPAAKLDADIEGLLLLPGVKGCEKIDGPLTRDVCPKVAELKSERGTALRRAELEATLKLSVNAAATVQVHDADPLAGAVATYAKAAGYDFSAEDALPWLALIPVAFLELGSALALVVVRGLGGPALPQHAPPVPLGVAALAERPAVAAEPVAPVQALPKRRDRRPPTGPAVLGDMVERVRKAGGQLEGSQRSIADALGVSKTTVQRTLQALIASGAVLASVSPQGTRLVLA